VHTGKNRNSEEATVILKLYQPIKTIPSNQNQNERKIASKMK